MNTASSGALRLLLAAALLFTAATSRAADAPKTVRLLAIGNSFTQNATHYLPSLVEGQGNKLILQVASIGGSTMQQHWDKAQLNEKDNKDPAGRYDGRKSLKEYLSAEPWQYVTIQQASIKSHDIASYRPFAGEMRDYIKKYAPAAELLLHETWEYRKDDPRFSPKEKKEGEPASSAQMYEMLHSAYATIAKELGVRRIPTGTAFHLANNDPDWGFKGMAPFDPKSLKAPAVPEQTHSLNRGWGWTKGKTDGKITLGMDGHHANTAGEYVGACCYYEVLFKESCVGAKFVPPGLNAEDAAYLQKKAHEAVATLGE